MLVALRGPPDAEGTRREEALGLVADSAGTPEHSPAYLWRGLTGGFPGRIIEEPLESVYLRYSEVEHRDVRLYRLQLDEAGRRAVLDRLDELRLAWDRPYRFFSANCVELPEELIAVLLGPDYQPIRPLAPDALLARASRAGLLEEVEPDRLEAWSLSSRALVAERLSRPIRRDLVRLPTPQRRPLRRALRHLDARAPERRAEGYDTLAHLAPQVSDSQRAALLRLLGLREPVERMAWFNAQERGAKGSSPAVEALRRATTALRAGKPPEVEELGDEAVMAALRVDRSGGSQHSPYRPRGVGAVVVHESGETWMGIGLEAALYEGRTGPGRRFPLSDDPALRLLDESLVIGLPLGHLTSKSTIVSGLSLPERPGPLRFGTSWTLGELRTARHLRLEPGALPHVADYGWQATALELRGLLGLRPNARLNRDLRPSLGLSLGGGGDRWGEFAPALSLPLGLNLELGSARQPRTVLRSSAALLPTWSGQGPADLRGALDIDLGLRVGELRGVDLILVGGGEARWEELRTPVPPGWALLRLGLGIERF